MEGLEEGFLAVSSVVDFPEGQLHEFPSSSWECSLPRVCGFPSPLPRRSVVLHSPSRQCVVFLLLSRVVLPPNNTIKQSTKMTLNVTRKRHCITLNYLKLIGFVSQFYFKKNFGQHFKSSTFHLLYFFSCLNFRRREQSPLP